MLRCDNVIADDPYEECDYTFMPSYREMFKLCFPTLGINLSGKTHWLAMLYRELCSRDSVAQAKFSKVRSKTSEEFDRIVDELIASRIGPSRTQTASLPQPLVFTLRDRDRMGISTVLLNLFDYSGEIYQGRSLEHPHRRRALHADGYFLFIDPTEPKEAQVRELENFREDLQLVRGLRPGQSVRTPIALCVSKIDLLGQQPYADPGGRGVIGQFYRDLAEVDASGERLDLGVIHGRSELVRGIRHQIWPGWDIEDKVRELFGGRFMYFPLTPVGLADLGVSDFRDKSSIEAFAIFEPLLWVLHMNGYRVFA